MYDLQPPLTDENKKQIKKLLHIIIKPIYDIRVTSSLNTETNNIIVYIFLKCSDLWWDYCIVAQTEAMLPKCGLWTRLKRAC